jgi:(p)ppGpp synthase/HD superfamily hydrolase
MEEQEVLQFATMAHGDQKRKYTGEPYIEHPKRVAETVRSVTHTSEMIYAAYLHDVVEDTPVPLDEIERKFGKEVAKLVFELTDEFIKENYKHLNRKQRKKKEVERQAKISDQAKTIKLADVIDNTRDIVKNDLDFARKYIPEMDALTEALQGGNSELLERARKEVQRGKEILNSGRRARV